MENKKRKIKIIIIIFVIIVLISALAFTGYLIYDKLINNETDDTPPVEDDIIEDNPQQNPITFKKIEVIEQPLSKIETNENSVFVSSYPGYLPYITTDGGMYYKKNNNFVYDNGTEVSELSLRGEVIGLTKNNRIYTLNKQSSNYYEFIKYENGNETIVSTINSEIENYYFSEKKLYYQQEQSIYMINGNATSHIADIPDSLYHKDIDSKFIIYEGKLWYFYNDEDLDYPLWNYDFNGNYTLFNKGGLEVANNGYIYYTDSIDYMYNLYRMSCTDYHIELVTSSAFPIESFAIGDNSIFYIACYDLYKINQNSKNEINIEYDTSLDIISYTNNRLFIGGKLGELIEIDSNGKLIDVIFDLSILDADYTWETLELDNNFIIKKQQVEERPLSKIETNENDKFASNYSTYYPYHPYINDDGTMYYYKKAYGADNPMIHGLFYDNLIDEATIVKVPHSFNFSTLAIIDNIIYGKFSSETEDGYTDNNHYIVKYENGVRKKIIENPIDDVYFAEEGIYYQIENIIYMVDYDGKSKKIIVEIPEQLYYSNYKVYSKFVVYKQKLWYTNYSDSYKFNYPLWSYDFNGTFTLFNKGGIEAINNGYIYYYDHNRLYRLNCDDYHNEFIGYSMGVIALGNNSIFYTSWTFDEQTEIYTDHLHRLNENGDTIILSSNQLEEYKSLFDSFGQVSYVNNRLFLEGLSEPILTTECLIEIDTDGNVIEIFN